MEVSDALTDLLLSLPAKSLLRFKSVCKSWLALIESPHFISKHFDSKCSKVLVRWSSNEQPSKYVEATSFHLFTDETLERFEKPTHLQMPHIVSGARVRYLLGPCKGIFCVATEHDEKIALWNPATRRIRLLPHHPLIWTRNFYHWQIGFGVDAVSNDAAIFKIVSFIGIGYTKLVPRFAVYTSEYDSWRIVKDKPLVGYNGGATCRHNHNCIFVDGFYYWMPSNIEPGEFFVILAFDMHREIFSKIEIPSALHDGSLKVDLTSYNDSLALLSYQNWGVIHIDLWLFQENKCWTKLATGILPFRLYRTSGYWKDNKIFIINEDYSCGLPNGSLYLYDMDSGNILKELRNHDKAFRGLGFAYYYKESLVQIKVGQETDFDSFFSFDRSRIKSKREYDMAKRYCEVEEESK